MMMLEGIEQIYELTPLQQGMLFHTLYAPESSVYNTQLELALEGDLDEGALDKAWRLLVGRYAPLRTSFVWERVEKPYQVVHRHVDLEITRYDWRVLSAAEQDQRRRSCLEENRACRFDLTRAPLMRLALIVLAARKFRLVWTFHHIILEGWSAAIVLNDFWKLYGDLRSGRAIDLRPVRPYLEYIHWLQRQDQAKAEAYWRETLKGFSAPTRLPIDHSVESAPAEVKRVDSCSLTLSKGLNDALKGLARTHRVTLNTVVQGAWSILLSRYSGEQDVVFGAVLSGRPSDLPGVESIVGLFVNTLPTRVKVNGNVTLIPWLQALQLDQVTMRQYEYSSLMQVQGWSGIPGGQPLFHSALAFENWLGDLPSGRVTAGLRVSVLETQAGSDQPLTLFVAIGNALTFTLMYDVERFEQVAVQRMLKHFGNLLEDMVAYPDQRLSELPLLTESERCQVVEEWNRTAREYGVQGRLHRLIEAQARRTPEAVALEFERREMTYAELNRCANQLARVLRNKGVGPDVLVGVLAERSFEMVVALLAVLKAGGAYVPLDPSYPVERLGHMLEDARAPLVLAQPQLAGELPASAAQVLVLDASWAAYAGESSGDLEDVGTPEDLAYVIFTSGSTGRPKGAMNEHRGIVNRLLWMQEEYGLTADDHVLQKTPFSFDVSVWEFFWPLMSGARLVIARPEGHRDSAYLVERIRQSGITTLHFVPSMLRVFLEEEGLEACGSLKRVICSGEALPHELQERFFTRLPQVELHNLYGPTEAAVDVTYWACRRGDERLTVPIGRPVANTQMYVLDRHMNPVPVGVAGELYIGGVQVGRGYVGRPELTAERFVPDPFSKTPGARLYKTGDLARHLADGAIEYLGRLDFQVKIRGQRIELGEIEAVLDQHPGVAQSVVLAREDAPGDQRLVAYAVVRKKAPSGAELKDHLNRTLPAYMVPGAFVFLETLPLTSSGKVDRKALPAPDGAAYAARGYEAPVGEVEAALAQIWAEVLKIERIGRHDHFFELGGHSLLATQVVSRASDKFDFRIPLKTLFDEPTLAGLADYIVTLGWSRQARKEDRNVDEIERIRI